MSSYGKPGPAARLRRSVERKRAKEASRKSMIERLRFCYERDAVAVGIEYAEAVWGSQLREHGAA